MRVLVVGGLGSIGSRYVAILRYLGHEPFVLDVLNPNFVATNLELIECKKAIIAAPTNEHYVWCKRLLKVGIPFLCEKPLSKDLKECKKLAEHEGYVVNNYAFALNFPNKRPKLSYDYFRTGKDGVLWDCCQLLHLDPDCEIKTESPIWTLTNHNAHIEYRALEQSYITMIKCFLNDERDMLWTLKDGLEMTKRVLARV